MHALTPAACPRWLTTLLWSAWARGWKSFGPGMKELRPLGSVGSLEILEEINNPAPSDSMERMSRALDLLHELDPRRRRRLTVDLDFIVLYRFSRTSHSAAFAPGSRTAYISITAIEALSDANLAVMLAHEGTHARLDRLRLVGWPRTLRYRLELRALREELAFAALLPKIGYTGIEAWIERRWKSSPYRDRTTRPESTKLQAEEDSRRNN
jgi:hypothetical protein